MRATTSSIAQAIPRVENIPAPNSAAHTLEVTAICMDCQAPFTFTVNAERYTRWISGDGRIGAMLPELPAEAHRLFISGSCSYGKCCR